MGKCVRIRGSSKPPPPAAVAASCLTLRSGRRVPPPVAACSPRPRPSGGRPRRLIRGSASGSARRPWCGAATEAAKKSACGRRRGAADAVSRRRPQQQQRCDGRAPETAAAEEMPLPSQAAARTGGTSAAVARGATGACGDSFDRRPKTPPPLMTDDCDGGAAAKAKARHENDESHRCHGVVVVAGQTLPTPPPTEAEIEAFFAAAELAERRRFAETYNYDVALDRPLEGRFEWAPAST